MAAQPSSFANITTNFFLSLYPINQLVKILHLTPKKHLNSDHHSNRERQQHEQPQIESTTQQTTQTLPTRRTTKRTTKLPHVTRSDLFNINRIHSASLNGLATQFQSSQNPAPVELASTPVQPNSNNNNNLMDSQEQTRKASQSSSVSQFVVPPAVQLDSSSSTPTAPSQPPMRPSRVNVPQSTQFTLQPATSPASSISSSRPPVTPNLINKFSPTLQTTQTDSGPQLATTNSISIHHSNSNNNNNPFAGSSTASSTTSSTTMSANHHQLGVTSQNVLGSLGGSVRASHNSLASTKYSLDGIIAVAIFGGFIFLGAIITIIVIIIRR